VIDIEDVPPALLRSWRHLVGRADILRRQLGQTLAEYVLIVAVIAVVVILAAVLFGNNVSGQIGTSAGHV
jgi:Flp pilus assembly pilin Flp